MRYLGWADECVRRHVDYLFSQGEDAGLAGNLEEAMGGVAAEPTRPLEAAIVDRTIEAVPGQRFRNETG
jgi:hypothetical protein